MGISVLKSKRHFICRFGDPRWLADRFHNMAAHYHNYTKLQELHTKLLDNDKANPRWTPPVTYNTITLTPRKEHCADIMDSICVECYNHCPSCVYDCQVGNYKSESVDDSELTYEKSGSLDKRSGSLKETWDKHRPLKQVMTIGSAECYTSATRGSRRSFRRNRKAVYAEPVWPAVLLTFDRGNSLRDSHKSIVRVAGHKSLVTRV